ncbi:hypothetical protein LCGC14_1034050 [marine sediment metagenome]|uniref:Tail assembly chaperone n=1 Tax=marine sediment metagenome TaxID=412755 RepID=A0A0F9QZR4_9ZZZZ
MPARLIDPKAEKTIEIGCDLDTEDKPIDGTGTSVVIIPLRRNLKRRTHQILPIIDEVDLPRKKGESNEKYLLRTFAKAFALADQDDLADVIGKSILKVDNVTVNGTEWLKNLEDNLDFENTYFEIMAWTGIDEETANFSDSSLDQSTAVLAGQSVTLNPPAKKGTVPASTTSKKTRKAKSSSKARQKSTPTLG